MVLRAPERTGNFEPNVSNALVFEELAVSLLSIDNFHLVFNLKSSPSFSFPTCDLLLKILLLIMFLSSFWCLFWCICLFDRLLSLYLTISMSCFSHWMWMCYTRRRVIISARYYLVFLYLWHWLQNCCYSITCQWESTLWVTLIWIYCTSSQVHGFSYVLLYAGKEWIQEHSLYVRFDWHKSTYDAPKKSHPKLLILFKKNLNLVLPLSFSWAIHKDQYTITFCLKAKTREKTKPCFFIKMLKIFNSVQCPSAQLWDKRSFNWFDASLMQVLLHPKGHIIQADDVGLVISWDLRSAYAISKTGDEQMEHKKWKKRKDRSAVELQKYRRRAPTSVSGRGLNGGAGSVVYKADTDIQEESIETRMRSAICSRYEWSTHGADEAVEEGICWFLFKALF